MEEKTNLQKLPSRIKYYLLDWKDSNMNEYIRKYGETKLNDLTLDQLNALFSYTTRKDIVLLATQETTNKCVHCGETKFSLDSYKIKAVEFKEVKEMQSPQLNLKVTIHSVFNDGIRESIKVIEDILDYSSNTKWGSALRYAKHQIEKEIKSEIIDGRK